MASSPDPARRPRASVTGSIVEGWRRAIGAPWVAGGVLGATILFAVPFASVVGSQIDAHLGSSLHGAQAAAGWNAGWAAEFAAGAQGLGRTFTHEILGFGGTIAIASRFVEGESVPPAVAGAVAGYVALWVFLSGGILDRFARNRRIGAAAFFSACGTYGVRFLRLGVVIGAAYWALFRWLHPFLFVTLYDRWTRDLTVERDAILLRVALYAIFLAALVKVNLIADMAKVRTVVEDRRSMLGAIAASIRFIRRRPWRVSALYLLNTVVLAAIVTVWSWTAPSATAAPWAAFLISEIYLLFRLWARLAFMASEAAFFQGELAHAHYTAAPVPSWPDSPAVEAIENLAMSALRAEGFEGQRAEGKGQREGKGAKDEGAG
jgi:hypothetical protein